MPRFPLTRVQARERGSLKKPTNPNCCFNHLGDFDHKPGCCNSIHFYVLVKLFFHTTVLPVCKNTKAFEVFLSIWYEVQVQHTVHMSGDLIFHVMIAGFNIKCVELEGFFLQKEIISAAKA